MKTLAVNTMQASELGTVATSDNRQRRHPQSRWARSMPSMRAMDAINSIIVKCQSTHKTSIQLMQQGEPWKMSLGATRRPSRQTRQRSCEDAVSITTILIPQQQSLSKERQLPKRKHNKRKQQSGGPLNRKPQEDWAYSCLRSPMTRTLRTTTKHEIKNLVFNNKKAAM